MADCLNDPSSIHVEILIKQNSLISEKEITASVANWLTVQSDGLQQDEAITQFTDSFLSEHISSIMICKSDITAVNGNCPEVTYHLYRFNSTSPEIESVEDDQQISTNWILPTEEFNGLWESLVYDNVIKNNLLNYVSTAIEFSERNVDPNMVSWNKIVLLHGPPGTGKTSLCKALAQKVCIRHSSQFQYGQLVEVNTHSLFSKWFSESGKLVTKMFHSIISLLEDPKVLVIVLLDEVETLARSRVSALHGNEPSDALRVVNAMLTHLDMIKRYPNVLILTTSNITEAIDIALIDRADIKQYIGLPSVEAIYQIYHSCIKELLKVGIICGSSRLFDLNYLSRALKITEQHEGRNFVPTSSLKLKSISEQSIGLSGRSLRKIPFIACSLFIKSTLVTLDVFLDSLSKAVEKHWDDVKHLKVQL